MKQVIFGLILCITLNAFATVDPPVWGQTGHRVTGEVASKYIKKRTAKKIKELLDGHSLAEVSTFADDIKSDKRFKKYGSWHYVNLKGDKAYGEDAPSKYGDLVKAIDTCLVVLKDDAASKDDKQFYLKLLIHFVGDLHMPLHVGNYEDKGGNDIKVTWFREESNLHRVWDSEMLDQYQMSYTEIANNFPKLSKDEKLAMQKGSVLDWIAESRAIALKIYAEVKTGDELWYPYMYENFETVKQQLEKGGVRLAKLLDEVFE